MDIKRHKVFISYYHSEAQKYKDELIEKQIYNKEKRKFESIFEDYSVSDGDIDDSQMTSEQIRRKIRDEYIKDATVLVLLCGRNTKKRKHIDWEIHAAMYDSEVNPKMGIIVINLPEINQNVRVSSDDEKPLVSPNSNWCHLSTREEYEKEYPYMPNRIIDNFVKNVPISVVEWNRIENDNNILMELIDNAFKRRKQITYDHSRILKGRNT